MTNIKYIVFLNQKGVTQSLMFPPYMEHAKVANMNMAKEVLGAGFCRIGNDKGTPTVECFGESVSLRLPSRPKEDSIKLFVDYFGLRYQF